MWALLKLTDDVEPIATQLAAEADEAIREAVASMVRVTEAGARTSLGVTLAIDRERTVQLAAIEQFKKDAKEPVPEMIALLEQVAAQPSQAFRCYSCGTANSAERDSCLQCNVVTAKPSEEARELLGKLRSQKLLAAHLSAHTITDRLEKIAAAFEVRSRAEIVAEAFRAGLI